MPVEPAVKRTIAFVDGQNLFHNARKCVRLYISELRHQFDVALIFRQDQDLSELGSLIRQVAGFQNRWIKIASAFPDSPAAPNRRGINRTDWCPIDKPVYDACIDPRDYRPKP